MMIIVAWVGMSKIIMKMVISIFVNDDFNFEQKMTIIRAT